MFIFITEDFVDVLFRLIHVTSLQSIVNNISNKIDKGNVFPNMIYFF